MLHSQFEGYRLRRPVRQRGTSTASLDDKVRSRFRCSHSVCVFALRTTLCHVSGGRVRTQFLRRSRPKGKTQISIFLYGKHYVQQNHISLQTAFRFTQCLILVGRGSSVGITARYGLDGPGIEFRWGEIFRNVPDQPCCPPSLLYRIFPGDKATGACVHHSLHLVLRLEKEQSYTSPHL